jgi:uncharacterized membrane protein
MANYPKTNLMTKDEVVTPYKQAYRYAFTERFDHVTGPNEPAFALGDGIEAVGTKKGESKPALVKAGFKKNPAAIVIALIFALLAIAFAALSYFKMSFLDSLDVFGGTIADVVDNAIDLNYASIALLASLVGALALVLTAIIGLAAKGRTLYWIAGLVAVVLALAAGALQLIDVGFDDILGSLGYGYIALAGAELLAFISACFGNIKK